MRGATFTCTSTPKQPSLLQLALALDDRRAVLGFYHLSSIISPLFKRGPQVSWAPYGPRCVATRSSTRANMNQTALSSPSSRSSTSHTEHTESTPHKEALCGITVHVECPSTWPSTESIVGHAAQFRPPKQFIHNKLIRSRFSVKTLTTLEILPICHHVLTMRLYKPAMGHEGPSADQPLLPHHQAVPSCRSPKELS